MTAKKTTTKTAPAKAVKAKPAKTAAPEATPAPDLVQVGSILVEIAPPPAKNAKAKPAKKAKAPTGKKVSAIDAAAQVLAGAKEPMNCKEMIEAMTKRALWTSPGGKTPHATLYSSIIREIAAKGDDARFKKTERGRFAANG